MKRKEKNQAIVQTVLKGNPSELKAFFDEYFPRLYRFTISRVSGDQEVAKEVVQNAFSKIMLNIHKFKGEASIFTWMCSICRNEIADFMRKQTRFDAVIELHGSSPELDSAADPSSSQAADKPDAMYEGQQKALLIHETLDRLPDKYGDILEWKYVEGLPVSKIAERLGLEHSAAQSLLYRARMAFQGIYPGKLN